MKKFLYAEGFSGGGGIGEDGIDKFALLGVEFQDALLDGIGTDETTDGDVFVLPDAVGAVGGLVFRGGIPPRVKQDDVIRSGEVEPHAAGFERDEEEITALAKSEEEFWKLVEFKIPPMTDGEKSTTETETTLQSE